MAKRQENFSEETQNLIAFIIFFIIFVAISIVIKKHENIMTLIHGETETFSIPSSDYHI